MENSNLTRTAGIVSAYVENNPLPALQLPAFIRSIHGTLTDLAEGREPREAPVPRVPIKHSVKAAYIVCLEDGKRLKMLKRYLRSRFGLSPEAYRTKWGLPIDYPMVAPNYAKLRSDLAKKIGLGRVGLNRKTLRGPKKK